MAIKKKDHENLTDSNIAKVIKGLESKENPITKKAACEILNISYNTKRLESIIESYKQKKETEKKRKKEKRGKSATEEEIKTIAEGYLKGESIKSLSEELFRSISFVKNIISRLGVPKKAVGEEKKGVEFLPDNCVSEDFEEGEIAWSAKYHAACSVEKEIEEIKKYGCKCYRVYIFEPIEEDISFNVTTGGFYAYAPAYDLGSLKHLKDLGVNLTC